MQTQQQLVQELDVLAPKRRVQRGNIVINNYNVFVNTVAADSNILKLSEAGTNDLDYKNRPCKSTSNERRFS